MHAVRLLRGALGILSGCIQPRQYAAPYLLDAGSDTLPHGAYVSTCLGLQAERSYVLHEAGEVPSARASVGTVFAGMRQQMPIAHALLLPVFCVVSGSRRESRLSV